jgi:hypothetical protein
MDNAAHPSVNIPKNICEAVAQARLVEWVSPDGDTYWVAPDEGQPPEYVPKGSVARAARPRGRSRGRARRYRRRSRRSASSSDDGPASPPPDSSITRHSEQTRRGIVEARAKGKQIGRPISAQPDPERVREMRARGRSWAVIARCLGCSAAAARRAAQRPRVEGRQS